jgi:hypothetical protein
MPALNIFTPEARIWGVALFDFCAVICMFAFDGFECSQDEKLKEQK